MNEYNHTFYPPPYKGGGLHALENSLKGGVKFFMYKGGDCIKGGVKYKGGGKK